MIRAIFAAVTGVFLAVPAWATIEIQEVTSPGGITAWLVETIRSPSSRSTSGFGRQFHGSP